MVFSLFLVLNSSRIDNKNIWEIASPSWWFLTHSTLWFSARNRGILNAISKTHQSTLFQTLSNGQCIRISVHKTATMHARKLHFYLYASMCYSSICLLFLLKPFFFSRQLQLYCRRFRLISSLYEQVLVRKRQEWLYNSINRN